MSKKRKELAHIRVHRSSQDSSELKPRKRESRLRNASAILSDQDIVHEIRQGNICIEPFKTRNLGHSCYYVTMGEYYYSFAESGEYLNPWNKKRILRHWEGPYKSVTINQEMFHKCGIPIGKKAIIIPGNTTILGYSQEFLGGLNYITFNYEGTKTLSYGRISLVNEGSSVEIGDIDRISLMIKNTTNSPTVIPVGARIAKIHFYYTGLPKFYHKGKTQTTADLDRIANLWKPDAILPKLPLRKFNIEKIVNPEYTIPPEDSYEPPDEQTSASPQETEGFRRSKASEEDCESKIHQEQSGIEDPQEQSDRRFLRNQPSKDPQEQEKKSISLD